MKILFINTLYYPDEFGGAEIFVRQLAERFATQGHTSIVLSLTSRNKRRCVEYINCVKVYRESRPDMKKRNLCTRLINEIFNPYTFSTVRWVINEEHPDIIHVNNDAGYSKAIYFALQSYQIPKLATMHDIHWFNERKLITYIPLYYRIYRRQINNCLDAIVAPSEYMKQIGVESGFADAKKLNVILNGTPVNQEQLIECYIEKKSRKNEVVNFLYVGRLEEYKGVEVLLKSLQINRNPCIRLHICGTGSLDNVVREAAMNDNRITFHGKLDRASLNEIYRLADVLIVPSIWQEPFGLTLIEGCSFACGVISTGRGGLKEIMQELSINSFYSAENPRELSSKLTEFMDRKTILEQVANYINNVKLFSLSRQCEEYMELYNKLISNYLRK